MAKGLGRCRHRDVYTAFATIDEVIYQEYGGVVVELGDGLRFGMDWD